MAYSLRYRIQGAGTLYDYRADILQEGYGGSLEHTLQAASPHVVITGGDRGSDETDAHKQTKATLRYLDDSGKLFDQVFNSGAQEFWVQIYRRSHGTSFTSDTWWDGFLIPDFYEDDDTEKTVVTLKARDGLKTLSEQAFDDSTFSSDTLLSAIADILGTLPFGIDLKVSQNWYAKLPADWASSTQPLTKLEHVIDNWRSDRQDRTSGWFSQYDVLKHILRRFELQIHQSGGAWWITQRSEKAIGSGTVPIWTYDSTGTETTGRTSTSLEQDLTDATVRVDVPRSGEQRASVVKVTHDYEDLGTLILNGSFEEVYNASVRYWTQSLGSQANLDTLAGNVTSSYSNKHAYKIPTDGDGTADLDGHGATAINQRGYGRIAGGAGKALAVRLKYITQGSYDVANPHMTVRLGGYHMKRYTTKVAYDIKQGEEVRLPVETITTGQTGEVDGVPVIPEGAKIISGTFTTSRQGRIGDTELFGEAKQDVNAGSVINFYSWQSSQNDMPIAETQARWEEDERTAFMIAPDGTALRAVSEDVSEDFSITFYQGVTGGVAEYYAIDLVEARVEEGGELMGEATTQIDTGLEGRTISVETRLGDGPNDENAGRLRAKDANGDYEETTWNWKRGAYSGGSGTNDGINELHAAQLLRQYRSVLTRREVTFDPETEAMHLEPHKVVKWNGKQWTVAYYQINPAAGTIQTTLLELRDDG